jgi:heme oxygenase
MIDQKVPVNLSILARLKVETAEVHRKVESVLKIMDPTLSREEYRNVLTCFFRIYRPLENRLAKHTSFLNPEFNLQLRSKAQLIRADLIDLGCTDAQLNKIKNADSFAKVNSMPTMIGALYVVEGATLGGQLICRSLRKNSELGNEAHRFFSGYGERTGLMWKEFCRLTIESTRPDDFNGILQSAKLTFEAIYQQLANHASL